VFLKAPEGKKVDQQCVRCVQGFGPKSVTGILPMNCLFCKDTLQTWYLYEANNKMRCTNCDATKYLKKPVAPEQCPACY